MEDAGEVGVDEPRPLLGRHLGDRAADADAGVVDQHVEAAEALHGRVYGAAHGGAVAHVAGHAHHPRGVVDRSGQRVLGAQDAVIGGAGDDHRVPSHQQRLGHGEADAPRPAGDQCG